MKELIGFFIFGSPLGVSAVFMLISAVANEWTGFAIALWAFLVGLFFYGGIILIAILTQPKPRIDKKLKKEV